MTRSEATQRAAALLRISDAEAALNSYESGDRFVLVWAAERGAGALAVDRNDGSVLWAPSWMDPVEIERSFDAGERTEVSLIESVIAARIDGEQAEGEGNA